MDDAHALPNDLTECHQLLLAAFREASELERVLDYPHIGSRLALSRLAAADVLAGFERHARIVEAPCKAVASCRDPDDQKFIDLAVQHKCLLLSKDAAVLTMEKRLAALEVSVLCALPAT